jgi:Xaa-Pro aminopeptidase
MFPSETYIDRRRNLREKISSGLILIPGNHESPMNFRDNPYPFRQDSSFLYYFGMDRPGLVALMDLDEDREWVFGDDMTAEEAVWAGPQMALRQLCEKVGVVSSEPLSQVVELLKKAKRQNRAIHILPPYRQDTCQQLSDLLRIGPFELDTQISETLIRAVVAQRSIKTQEEIEQIESALAISRQIQVLSMQMAEPGRYERDIVGAMEGLVLAQGSRTSFPTILTVHGHILHHHDHQNQMKDQDMVLNDSGVESPLHYASDITRTFPVGGRFTDRQKEVYEIVLQAQEDAIGLIKPGVEFREVHFQAALKVANGLKDLGLMRGDVTEAVQAGAYALFFPTGLGHMLGLDVHDMEGLGEDYVGYTDSIKRRSEFGWRSLRLARALEPGFVITVEPGIYFIPELIGQWKQEGKFASFINYGSVDRFLGFGGIRIEDDVIVTQTGARILGPQIPKSIFEVEETCSRKT